LAGGVIIRLGWLGIGFLRLRRYRRRSQRLAFATPWSTRAQLRLSPDISSPVTFGIREPVVLLPSKFNELDGPTQEAILCHELLHVKRRDWLFAVGEELVRGVFWFHPAIWWLVGEIQLAREQAVDRAVIELTKSRDHYVDALLAIAGSKPQLDLAPAPMLLRRRHLKQRVISILKDSRMSRARVMAVLAASFGILVAAVWLTSNTFPLAAAPRIVNEPAAVSQPVPGAAVYQGRLHEVDLQQRRSEEEERVKEEEERVKQEERLKAAARERMQRSRTESVDKPRPEIAAASATPVPERIRVGGNVQQAKLISQRKPIYPPLAKQARIQGTVRLSAVIGKDGTIQQLEVISGHPFLAPVALEAVKDWVYEPTLLEGNPVEVVTQIDVNFTLSQ
jgi:TonB family protein